MIASDIIVYLTSQSVGGVLLNAFEEAPGVIPGVRSTVTPYGGSEPMMSHASADDRIDVARFQVMTQGSNKTAVEREAYKVQNVLVRVRNQMINGIFYRTIQPLHPPHFLKWSDPVNGIREVSYVADYEALKDPYIP